jgi:tRNA uridine 5-carbamoylmethylation protein Kti12
MAGHPGSGKSTLSKKIAMRSNAIVIDRDAIKAAMVNFKIPEDVIANASYSVVFDIAQYYLAKQISVIIDIPCCCKKYINHGIRISKKHGADYKYIECFNNDLDISVKPQEGNFITVDTSTEESYDITIIDQYLRKKTDCGKRWIFWPA